ncbi:hypothetical protein BDR03DRAFT_966802 [Suillus americanus]|nr:hypothetical protein BDR03DRAFT_966802 [Suillus americanus]
MSNPPLFRDLWAKREARRKSLRAMFSGMFPGFVIAYVTVDNFYSKTQPLGAQQKH